MGTAGSALKWLRSVAGVRHLVICRIARNFADATLSANRTDSSFSQPGVYVTRDRDRDLYLDAGPAPGRSELEWRAGR